MEDTDPDSIVTRLQAVLDPPGGTLPRFPATSAAEARDLPERITDRYRVLERIGSGGMATVFLVEDVWQGCRVAVKRMSFAASRDPELEQRFTRERALLESLAHPRLVPLLDHGRDDGRSFLVMPWFEGGSLHQRILDGGALRPDEALRILSDVLDALEACHAAGVVHRDIKPANVLLDAKGRAHLADFGIAHGPLDRTVTRAGVVLGTASFMAPEQAVEPHLADERADIYAIGATLYAMVTARRPVALHQERLDSERLQRLPEPIRAVVHRATRLDPDYRQPDVATMRRELQGYRPSPLRALVMLACAVVVGVVLGLLALAAL